MDLFERPDWHHFARCADREQFGDNAMHAMFPTDGNADGIEYAKSICSGCSVRIECLEWAFENGEQSGVWGGLTTEERKLFRRRRARIGSDRPIAYADLPLLDED